MVSVYSLSYGGLTTRFALLVNGSRCSMLTGQAVLAVRSTHPAGVLAHSILVVWVETVENRGCLLNFALVKGRDFRCLAGAVASCLLGLHLNPCPVSPGFAH